LSDHPALDGGEMSRLDIAAAYIAARWRQHTLSGPALTAWQDRRAASLVEHVRAHSPFHRTHWEGIGSADWRTFPTVDKAMMMAAFDTFTTIGIRRDDAMRVALDAETRRDFSAVVAGHTVGLSSGTSGHRGLFLVSPDEQTRWAGTILARAIPDLRPGHRVAFFLRANSRLYERTGSVVQFRFFDLMQPLAEVIESLNRFMPRLIVGPPSLLAQLADARERGVLRVRPSRLISVAEVLEPQDRARLESVFDAPVGQVYQCTEGLVAVSCPHGELHVQEDVMVLQPTTIDPADPLRIVPTLTDLWRRSQPIIRYRLGDILRLDPAPCRCGSRWQRIAAVEGRQDDVCWFPRADDTLRLIFPDAIRRMILLADDRIREYRAEQSAAGELQVHLIVDPAAPFTEVAAQVRRTVHAALAGYGCQASAVHVAEGIPAQAPDRKRRRVICTWHPVAAATASHAMSPS
jgi:putative adenylate-forming enzyme